MKKLLVILITLLSSIAHSQDTVDYLIEPNWMDPNVQNDSVVLKSFDINDIFPEKIIPNWIAPEPDPVPLTAELTESDIKLLEADVKFMTELPQSYQDIPTENLKTILSQIDNKIIQLRRELDELIKQRTANQDVIKTKQNTLTVLEKERSIINLTLAEGELKDTNGNLVGQNDELKVEQNKLKKYLYLAISCIALLGLIVAIVLQRKRINVQGVEIDEQLNEINKKNSYLEHAARIIRHDMHSGINTYLPRGINSLEKRLSEDDIQNLKIGAALKMIKEGLNHTQRVYKSVYEFTNLVKREVVLNKSRTDLRTLLTSYISSSSYKSQVEIFELCELEINEILFCTAVENLIKNGLTYNDSEEKIVKIFLEDEYLIIEDNGIGFSQSKLDKQLKKYSNSKKDDEIGLGLNICAAILMEHGFSLSCEDIETGTKMKIKIINKEV